eukprot:896099-Heterocapsa_arctica.AAC.1
MFLLPADREEVAENHSVPIRPFLLPGFDVGQIPELSSDTLEPPRIPVQAEPVRLNVFCRLLG